MGKIERIDVPPEDRERLCRLARDRNTPQKVIWRAHRFVGGGGIGAVDVGREVGVSVLTVRRWRRRCLERRYATVSREAAFDADDKQAPLRIIFGERIIDCVFLCRRENTLSSFMA